MHKGNYVLCSLYYKQKRQTVRTTWPCSQAAKQPATDQALINLGHLGMGKNQPEKQGFVWLRDIKPTSQCYLFLTSFRIIRWNQTPSSFNPSCVSLLSVDRLVWCSTSQSWGLLTEGEVFSQPCVCVAAWCQHFCRCSADTWAVQTFVPVILY